MKNLKSKRFVIRQSLIGKNVTIESGAMIEDGANLKKKLKIKFSQIVKK